jgi:predicted MFS family arabinose efflux permease
LFDEARGVRAIGVLGSIEALAPAVAPIIGAWLLALGGWRLSFALIGVLALLLAASIALWAGALRTARRERGRYSRLLADPVFLRYALSQAFILGGLLTFVFGMPAVLVHSLDGSLRDFIVMQITGIAGFIVAANLSGKLASRHGTERIIGCGTAVAAAGALAILAYALHGGRNPLLITLLFFPVNTGLGLRGPPGFYRAVLAAQGDDARGAALVILGILGAAALGTVVAAPLIAQGLAPLAGIALAFHVLACLSLVLLPRLPATTGA